MSQTTLQPPRVETSDSVLTLEVSKGPLKSKDKKRQIWWSNAIFFIAFHVVGLGAWVYWPSSWRTWFLCYINWQLGTLGITIGIYSSTQRIGF